MSVGEWFKSKVDDAWGELQKHLPNTPDAISAAQGFLALVQNGGPPLVPVDPKIVLKAVAEGIMEAERALNAENLLIASGSVELTVNVIHEGNPGALARIMLDIRPIVARTQSIPTPTDK